ncbi:MAG: porin family protein [Bacteroidaceae bacterium]|nr:porin family protein [Bacteroidaceae bacterium]
MKKILAIVSLISLSLAASAQVRLGLKAGFDVSKMSVDSEVFKADNRVGFFIGPMIRGNVCALGIAHLGFDASAVYEQRNAKLAIASSHVSSSATSPNITRKSISIPINARLGLGYGETVEAFLKAGPQVSFNMGSDKIEWNYAGEKFSAALKDTEYSVNIGAGITLLGKVEVAANYNIVMGNSVKDFNQENYDNKVKNSWKDLKNNAWQISATWFF